MKLLFILAVWILSFQIWQQKSKLDLISQKWCKIGVKSFGKSYVPVDYFSEEVLLIKENGSYEKDIHGEINIKGKWKFSMILPR
jgi:hypothetical protein